MSQLKMNKMFHQKKTVSNYFVCCMRILNRKMVIQTYGSRTKTIQKIKIY